MPGYCPARQTTQVNPAIVICQNDDGTSAYVDGTSPETGDVFECLGLVGALDLNRYSCTQPWVYVEQAEPPQGDDFTSLYYLVALGLIVVSLFMGINFGSRR